MKTIIGNNNFALVNDTEFELDEHTSIITNASVAEVFSTQAELVTFVASQNADNYPVIPEIGEWCEENKVYKYGADKAKCIQGHNRMSFPIEDTPALWLIIHTISEGYPEWKQPTGAHDAYQIGDIVSFNGQNYESVINANVWSPTAYPQGWKTI